MIGLLREKRKSIQMEGLIATLVLLVPSIILLAVTLFIPTGYVIFQSFFDWRPNFPSPFVGLENYITVLTSESFQTVMKNQFFFLLGMPLWIMVPLIITYFLYEDVKFASVWRTIYFLPSVLSPALVGIQFRSILGFDGVINTWFRSVGLDNLALDWLSNPNLVKPIIILLILWSGIGTGVIIFSAAMAAIPKAIFEAAKIDGVGWWARFFHIVMPMIKNSIALWGALQILSLFLFMFSWIYVLTSGGPGLSSTTIDYLIYQEVFRFGFFPTAAAMSVLLILTLLAIFLVQGLINKKLDGDD